MKALDAWMPPDTAGAPVGCIASSFTFDAEFFEQECLDRYLGITSAPGYHDGASELAITIEREERLAGAPATVMVDRSHRDTTAHNLRWDLLPVAVPDGGLLHAKTAVLVWEHQLRLIIGSANLTPAGYRRQIEIIAVFDISPSHADLPRPVVDAFLAEVERLVTDLIPVEATGPRARALSTLGLAGRLVEEFPLANRPPTGTKMALAPSGSGRRALASFPDVWKGPMPTACLALSPFWDGEPGGPGNNGIAAAAALLSTQPRGGRPSQMDLVVTVEPVDGEWVVNAPATLSSSVPEKVTSSVVELSPDPDQRRLHAKWITFRSHQWIAAMFGSSNLTAPGLGLSTRSHRELNLWVGAHPESPEGQRLARMIDVVGPIELTDYECQPDDDDDLPALQAVPAAFISALLTGTTDHPELVLSLRVKDLPRRWSVRLPEAHAPVIESTSSPPTNNARIPLDTASPLPLFLSVRWTGADSASHEAPWVVNVDDPALLPDAPELRDLSVDALMTVLASTQPLSHALAKEFRNVSRAPSHDHPPELDPLKKHASSKLLLQRVRKQSAALVGLSDRLERPMCRADTLEWRLFGPLGPVYLARRIVGEAGQSRTWLPGEAEFFLAELALTVRRVTWMTRPPLKPSVATKAARRCISEISDLADGLSSPGLDPALQRYVELAFAEAKR